MLFAASFLIFNFYLLLQYLSLLIIPSDCSWAENMCSYYQTTADQRLLRGKPVAMFLEF